MQYLTCSGLAYSEGQQDKLVYCEPPPPLQLTNTLSLSTLEMVHRSKGIKIYKTGCIKMIKWVYYFHSFACSA